MAGGSATQATSDTNVTNATNADNVSGGCGGDGDGGGGGSASEGSGSGEAVEDISAIRDLGYAIEFATISMISIKLGHSDATKCKVRLQFPEAYPAEPVLVEVFSNAFPPPLTRKMIKMGSDEGAKIAKAGERSAVPVATLLHDFVQNNRFVACWKEVRQITNLVSETEGGQMSLDEAEGSLRIRVVRGHYRTTFRAWIYPSYPEGGTELSIERHNFWDRIADMHLNQGREVVLSCLKGYPPDLALKASNPISAPPPIKRKEAEVRMTNEQLHNIKHDVAYFKKASDLKSVNSDKDKRNQSMAHDNQTRKDARKELRRLNGAEQKIDAHQEKRMIEREQAEALALQQRPMDYAQPSLYVAVKFMVSSFAARLPEESCQACGKAVLPADPNTTKAKTLAKSNHPERPMRVFCGHWFHHCCLDEWLRNPPFIRSCPACERRIWHPEWPSDIAVLERAWANEQSTKRELEDVKDFFF